MSEFGRVQRWVRPPFLDLPGEEAIERKDLLVDLFAGVAVTNLERASVWFDQFLGDAESFEPNDTERV